MQAIKLMKYMTKNYLTNPVKFFLMEHWKVILAVLAFLSLIIALSPRGPPTPQEETLRESLLKFGITKERAITYLSAGFTALSLALGILSRGTYVTQEEAHELVLTQPVTVGDFLTARTLSSSLSVALLSTFYLIPMVPEVIKSSGNKGILSYPAALLMLVYFFTFSSFLVMLGERIKPLLYAYALVAVLDSLIRLSPSPLLTAPFWIPVASLVFCITITESTGYVILLILLTSTISALMLVFVKRLGDELSPEDLKPLVYKVKAVKLEFRVGRVAYDHFVRSDILSASSMRNFLITSWALALAGVTLNRFMPWSGWISEFVPFMIPVILVTSLSSLLSMSLAEDLVGLWIYRVYGDANELTRALMLKYSLYMGKVLAYVSFFEMGLMGSPEAALFPLIVSPVLVLSSFILLYGIIRISSKRRVYRRAYTGIYVLESIGISLVMAIIAILLSAFIPYFLLIKQFARLALPSSVINLAIGYLLFKVLSRTLASKVEAWDIK